MKPTLERETRFLFVCAAVCAAAACGKKGPPLTPFPRVPALVTTVAAMRVGPDVYLSFTVPSTNVDGHQPADIAVMEIYAVTAAHPPDTAEQRKVATLIGTLPVHPILPPLPPLKDGTPASPLPLPPGVDQGAPVVFKETLTDDTQIAVELPVKRSVAAPVRVFDEEPLPGPLVAPTPVAMPRRYYFVRGVSPGGRPAVPSTPVAMPLDLLGAAPGLPTMTYTEAALTITWSPSPDAKTATMAVGLPAAALLAAPVVPVATGAATTPVPAAPPPLAAKSLGFTTVATTYHVFEVPAEPPPDDPLTRILPRALTPQPTANAEWVIKGVTFGQERCFQVRAVDTVSGVVVQSPPSKTACVTPKDTFPPAAPKSLAAISGAGVVNLIWEPNTESDLAGYLVLRGEAPGATLQAMTPTPVRDTTFRDTTVRAGVRYVYVVVAVDTADPQNVSAQSNAAEETARQ